ncbi:molybdopterin molybdotransferase MoeA [Arthrobacter echini]|uniref:Molybdopterin molybdenumtransferase n=1 Tax=Arthrobacter echini TaxID=1529066 RepID=A0A4S5E888_9MICC|nr:gephyrin-like molybdotransferase Glp [Arthrobacter echini]THJ67720.1 molybdopterin molybdotransferase MoeA [Arthrobacter echini]
MRRTIAEHGAAVAGLLRWSSGYPDDAPEVLPLIAALGRALAEDVHAPVSLPPFDNSQMDGYAVHSADLAEPSSLRVTAAIAAGSVPPALEIGTAAPIMTGAMLPDGAGAVVPIERAVPAQFHPAAEVAGGQAQVQLPGGIPPAQFVRRAGSDIAAGQIALESGTLLGPAQLGLLAACGVGEVPVRPRFRVLLLSTGDEVAAPGGTLAPGTIYDANTTLLEAALLEAGAEVTRHGLLGDDPAVLRDAFAAISAGSTHLVLSTGGISQGAYEVVKQALADSSVEFSSVAMQPGGPQAHGTISGIPFLGFPGNPVSAIVSFEMFLRPALHQLTGIPAPRPVLEAVLTGGVESVENKHQLRRGLYRDGRVAVVGGPDSHLLHALAQSNCLMHLPEGVAALQEGDRVEITLTGPVPVDPFAVVDVLLTESLDNS